MKKLIIGQLLGIVLISGVYGAIFYFSRDTAMAISISLACNLLIFTIVAMLLAVKLPEINFSDFKIVGCLKTIAIFLFLGLLGAPIVAIAFFLLFLTSILLCFQRDKENMGVSMKVLIWLTVVQQFLIGSIMYLLTEYL
jgi:hypothetical protein